MANLLLEVLQWFLRLIPVSSLRCIPLRQYLVDLSLQASVLLLQPFHLAQVVGQSVVQTPQCVLVVCGGVGFGRGGFRLIRPRALSLVLAQHVAQPLRAGHGRPGAPSSGSTEHTGSAVGGHDWGAKGKWFKMENHLDGFGAGGFYTPFCSSFRPPTDAIGPDKVVEGEILVFGVII